ncbi:MAG TPA: HYR domain-containing protein [Gemmatimonadaceae bacterium]|nr:HYR domain-containing protein [Gemmatimonadaceae bacterium]
MFATILSCSDHGSTTAPVASVDPALAGVKVVVVQVPDSLKRPWIYTSPTRMLGGISFSRDVTAQDAPPALSAYTVSSIDFTPEPSPAHVLIDVQPEAPTIDCGDCVAFNVPIGFDFTFYGRTYNQVDVSSNGLVGFGGSLGTSDSPRDGCCMGWSIPDPDFNNLIALAWTDWTPSKDAPVTVETQGAAPNRKFVLQWNSTPEFLPGHGHLTAQLVLSEGSNDITMYTTAMNVTNEWHVVTQGIENAGGSEGAFLPGRVQELFSLSNDAIRFSIRPLGKPISLVPSANLEIGTDARACFATVAVAAPAVSGGGDGLTVQGTRNDRLPLDAAYPKGVTTITWAATDAAGITELATQTVTVVDREGPQITVPPNVIVGNDPGLASAHVSFGRGEVADNCPNYSLEQPADGVFPVGNTEVVWRASDESGNASTATQLVTVKDVESPKVTVSGNVTVDADQPAGAVVTFANFGSDNVGVTSFACDQLSGNLFPIGVTAVSCVAVDAAGNRSAPASFNITVLGAPEQIVSLIEFVRGFPIPEPGRTELVNALQAALSNPRNTRLACPALSGFISSVRLKTPSVFSSEKSAQIIGDATRIGRVIGCAL